MEKHYIKIGNTEYEILPITELTFDSYKQLLSILSCPLETVDDVVTRNKYILSTLGSIPLESLNEIEEESLLEIPVNMFLERQSSKKLPSAKFKNYTLLDINSISMGRFIDLYEIRSTAGTKIEMVIALLFAPNDSNFDNKLFEEIQQLILKEMKVGDAIQYLSMYDNYMKQFFKDYEGLFQLKEETEKESKYTKEEMFDDEIEEEESSPMAHWGMLAYVYQLCNGNYSEKDKILNDPHLEVFNFLSYQKELADLQREAERKSQGSRVI